MTLRIAITLLVLAAACRKPEVTATTPKPAAEAPPSKPAAGGKPKKDPAFPDRPKRGWEALDDAARARASTFATDYAAWLGAAKTPTEAVSGLIALFGPGASELRAGNTPGGSRAERSGAREAGTRFWLRGPGGQAAAFVRVGDRPIEEGVRVVVAAVDAPRFDLKQQPLDSRAGLALLDTVPYGDPDYPSWLAHPLALHVRSARPGAASGDLDLVIGEAEDDPVLLIPDLEPHLSGKVQRPQLVDSAERMDAVAARSQKALLDYLAGRGVSARELTSAEAMLVPAGPPVFLGVDRARLGGYGHGSRAAAYAAVRALMAPRSASLGSGSPGGAQTAVVVIVGKQHTRYSGAAGEAFVRLALSRVIAALAGEADLLVSRRIYARSAALVARIGGDPGEGVALSPPADDALPPATRRALDRLAAGGAQVQIVAADGWGSAVRQLASLDMDACELGLPVTATRTPTEVVQVFDLHHLDLAMEGWLTR